MLQGLWQRVTLLHIYTALKDRFNPGLVARDQVIDKIFNIYDRINGTQGMITGYLFMWVNGTTYSILSPRQVHGTLSVMGKGMNGIVEVHAVLAKCANCEEVDGLKLNQAWDMLQRTSTVWGARFQHQESHLVEERPYTEGEKVLVEREGEGKVELVMMVMVITLRVFCITSLRR